MGVAWIAAIAIISVVVFVNSVLLLALIRQLSVLQADLSEVGTNRSPGLPLTSAPVIADRTFDGIYGERFTLSDLWSQAPLLVFFLSTGCAACTESIQQLSRLVKFGGDMEVPLDLQIAIISSGHPENVKYMCEFAGLPRAVPVAAVSTTILSEDYAVTTTPTLALVKAGGRVESVLVGSADEEQVRRVIHDARRASTAKGAYA